MRATMLLVSLGLAGCTGEIAQANGNSIYQAFAFDAAREWTYIADKLDYRLQARQLADAETVGDNERVFTIEYYYDCISSDSQCATDGKEATKAFTWKWSADLARGVLIYAYDDTTYDPPVQVAKGTQMQGSSVTTTSGAATYTSTFEAVELCPAPSYWSDPDNSGTCYKLVVDDGGAGTPIAGTYWATNGFGLAAFTQGDTNWSMSCFHSESDANECR